MSSDNLQKAEQKVNREICDLQIVYLQNAGMERFQRLKIARERFFKNATEAAASLGVPYGTYSGHEAGSRGIKEPELELYARRFKVPLAWLTFGEGTISAEDASMLRVVGRVGAGARIDVAVDQSVEEFVQVKLPLPKGAIGFEVLGPSMYPAYKDGDMIVCLEDGVAIDEVPDGTEAAVVTEEGDRYLKMIFRAEREGFFNLESHNAPPIRGVRLKWISDILFIVPKRKWDRLIEGDQKPQSAPNAKKKKR